MVCAAAAGAGAGVLVTGNCMDFVISLKSQMKQKSIKNVKIKDKIFEVYNRELMNTICFISL
jgi:hypothetical protein